MLFLYYYILYILYIFRILYLKKQDLFIISLETDSARSSDLRNIGARFITRQGPRWKLDKTKFRNYNFGNFHDEARL